MKVFKGLLIILLLALVMTAIPATAATPMQQAKLTASGGAIFDEFGRSAAVSADGGTAVIGAEGRNNRTGAAYIFTRAGTTWSQQATLTANDGVANDGFGWSVAVSADGSTAVIGTWSKNAAYVFLRSGTTWSQQAKLAAADGTIEDQFGWSVAVSADGSTALIGSVSKNTFIGAAYIFVRVGTTWTQQAELAASDGVPHDGFGNSVAVSADSGTAVIGAIGKNNIGAAYVFRRAGTTWSQQATLIANDGARNDEVGGSVAVSADGGTVIVGAVGGYNYIGAAYIFVRVGTTWSQQAKLAASDGVTQDNFGWAVAVSADGGTALIGAIGKNGYTGAAYTFSLRPSPPSSKAQCNDGGWQTFGALFQNQGQCIKYVNEHSK